MMRVIQCVLLTAVAVFVAAVNGATLQQIPFFVSMAEGDTVEVAEHGPFTFSAACDSSAVTLEVNIEATQEDYIFTDYTSPFFLMAGNTSYCPGVFRESNYGNDAYDGGFVSASGYYVGWDGESVIGLHLASGATQPTLGTNVSCVVSGVVKLIEKS